MADRKSLGIIGHIMRRVTAVVAVSQPIQRGMLRPTLIAVLVAAMGLVCPATASQLEDGQSMTPSLATAHSEVNDSVDSIHALITGGVDSDFAATMTGPGATGRAATVDNSREFSFGYLEFEGTPEQRAVFGRFESGQASVGGSLPSQALMTEIVAWLSANFELPATDNFPRVEFATPAKLTALRFGAFSGPREIASGPASPLKVGGDLLAVYDTSTRTIYLAEGWSGTSRAETSILVHEMVHHLQNAAGLTYACVAAREQLAYLAQDLWLRRFGQDLTTAIDADLFTALARSLCFY